MALYKYNEAKGFKILALFNSSNTFAVSVVEIL